MQFAEAIKTLPELRRMASDPLFPPIVRKSVIEAVLKDSGATEVTKRLFCECCLCASPGMQCPASTTQR